jgi:hypothetical protein
MNKEEALDKLQKLLAMQTSPNQHEVENALYLAEKLKRQFEISEDQLKKIEAKQIGVVRNNLFVYTRPPWMFRLVDAIAGYYDCKVLQQSYKKTFCFIGFEFDTKVAVEMATYVITAFQRLAEEESKNQLGSKRGWKLHFLWGATSAICTRLVEMKEAQKMKDNSCRALVVAKETHIKSFIEVEFKKITTKALISRIGRGTAEGYVAGTNLSLQVQVGMK